MDVDVDVDKSHYIHESGCTHFVSCRMGMMPCITRFSVSMKIYSRKSMNVPKHARVFKYVHSLINFDR